MSSVAERLEVVAVGVVVALWSYCAALGRQSNSQINNNSDKRKK
jgi:hypothetical protein